MRKMVQGFGQRVPVVCLLTMVALYVQMANPNDGRLVILGRLMLAVILAGHITHQIKKYQNWSQAHLWHKTHIAFLACFLFALGDAVIKFNGLSQDLHNLSDIGALGSGIAGFVFLIKHCISKNALDPVKREHALQNAEMSAIP